MGRLLAGVPALCWCWPLAVWLLLSGCHPAYRFQYQSTLIAPTNALEDAQVRILVTPTTEVGVLQLTVANQSLERLTIVWPQSRYIDPLGRTRPVVETGPTGILSASPARGTPVEPGETVVTAVRPGGTSAPRELKRSRHLGESDLHLPPEEQFHAAARPAGQITVNPFTVSRSSGGEVSSSTASTPLLPLTGATPATGQAYQGREFRFILALQRNTGVTPYAFTFRITGVDVRDGNTASNAEPVPVGRP